MNASSTGLRRWTQSFVVLSAAMLVGYYLAIGGGAGHRTVVTIGVFGFVCPMIFGMAYLLLPPYVGRTLVDHRVAGVHFALTVAAAGLLVADPLLDGLPRATALGAILWSCGVLVFVGSLAVTIGPALREQVRSGELQGDRPKRSTRAATATIPVAIAYLVVGTLGLVLDASGVAAVARPRIVHVFAVGFGALLVFGLGARLLVGFFHVSPPRYLSWPVLATGALAPAFLGRYLWIDPWFRLGAVLETVAMTGYLGLVVFVAHRSDWDRVGLYGIALGALAGAVAVWLAGLVAFQVGAAEHLLGHVALILGGFFPLTIVGYAYQFFPVTAGQFRGATERTAVTTIALIAVGVAGQAVGIIGAYRIVRSFGATLSLAGAVVYLYLLARRFAGS